MARQKKPKSLFRRFIYFVVMLVTGSGAGMSGWAVKDHPLLQAVLGRVVPRTEDGSIDSQKLTSAVTDVLKRDDGRSPGLYKVKVTEVRLDPKLFKAGRTVDIQARVRQRDTAGRENTVWESRSFGENLGQVGRDDITATWSNRPFEIDWSPGDKIVVEIWDRKSGFFEKKELKMAPSEPGVFPMATGPHPLSLSGADLDLARSRIVFESQRMGEARANVAQKSRQDNPREIAERPIVIK